MLALAALTCTPGVGQEASRRAEGVGGPDDPGLRRLEARLEDQLGAGRNALPLPWGETILKPDTARLVWRAHSLSTPNRVDRFRVAIDPPTRWYYIGQVGRAGTPLKLYGPLEERVKGTFIDVLAPAGTASPAAPSAAGSGARPKAKRSGKPDSKPKPKSSTKVKN